MELINPRSKITGATPVLRPSEHFFLRLSALEAPLKEWVGKQAHWRRNVLNFTLGSLNEGLKDRAITRDINWGVPVPVPGFETKRIYVWFDAVIGYLSATKEWAQRQGDPDAWKRYWQDPDTRSYYFIGKDNIPFHTIIWPAMLMGYGNLDLPYDVPANQYVNFSAGQKQSKSKGTGTWVLNLLDTYSADTRALLSDIDIARNQRLRISRRRTRPGEQRRADRDVGQPRQSRDIHDPSQLRWHRPSRRGALAGKPGAPHCGRSGVRFGRRRVQRVSLPKRPAGSAESRPIGEQVPRRPCPMESRQDRPATRRGDALDRAQRDQRAKDTAPSDHPVLDRHAARRPRSAGHDAGRGLAVHAHRGRAPHCLQSGRSTPRSTPPRDEAVRA